MEEMGSGNFEISEMLSKYPVIDTILVIFMRTILILGHKCTSFEDSIDTVELYEFLSDYFEVEITYYNNCLRFNLTDLFVYF